MIDGNCQPVRGREAAFSSSKSSFGSWATRPSSRRLAAEGASIGCAWRTAPTAVTCGVLFRLYGMSSDMVTDRNDNVLCLSFNHSSITAPFSFGQPQLIDPCGVLPSIVCCPHCSEQRVPACHVDSGSHSGGFMTLPVRLRRWVILGSFPSVLGQGSIACVSQEGGLSV